METKTTEVVVDVASKRDFERAVATLNKQARRLGVPEITIKHEGKVTRTRTIVQHVEGEEPSVVSYPVDVDRYTVSRPVIVAAGWKIVGSVTASEEGRNFVEHIDKSVQINLSSYESVPAGRCQHCNTSRTRKQTYIVANEDGRRLQVGRQCLSELTHGCDVRVLEWQSVLCQFDGDGEWGGGGGGMNQIRTIKLTHAIALALAIADDRGGWIDNQYEEDAFGERSIVVEGTHRIASHLIRSKLYPETLVKNANWKTPFDYSATMDFDLSHNKTYAQFHVLYESKIEVAEGIIDEIRNIDESTLDDFGRDMKYLTSFDWIPVTKAGLTCYAPRWLERKKENEERKRIESLDVNEHIGEVGQRGTFYNLTLRKFKLWYNDYGQVCLYIWADKDGRKVVYIGSGDAGPTDLGTAVRIKATIKRQDERDGVKQTVVSRVGDVHAYAEGEERGSGFITQKTRKKKE